MTYAAGTLAPNTSPLATLDATLTAAGFDRVESGITWNYQGGANVATGNVYRSPAASNSANQEWFLLIGTFVSGANRWIVLTVCESYDVATDTLVRYVPLTPSGITPAADFSTGATGVGIGSAALHWIAFIYTEANGSAYTINATPDRVMFLTGPQSAPGACWYFGLFDRTYPTTLDPVNPLGFCNLISHNGAANADRGGITRTPGATTAHANNFRVYVGNGVTSLRPFVPSGPDPTLGRTFLSPIAVADGRHSSATSFRAMVKDIRSVQGLSSGATDSLNETGPDGVARTYFAINTTGQFFPMF